MKVRSVLSSSIKSSRPGPSMAWTGRGHEKGSEMLPRGDKSLSTHQGNPCCARQNQPPDHPPTDRASFSRQEGRVAGLSTRFAEPERVSRFLLTAPSPTR